MKFIYNTIQCLRFFLKVIKEVVRITDDVSDQQPSPVKRVKRQREPSSGSDDNDGRSL